MEKKNNLKRAKASNKREAAFQLKVIQKDVRKGQNGKLLIIGGSTLFHSPPLWAAQLASHFVDLVFVYSPACINREILIRSKEQFRNGIVVESADLEDYIREADTILLGPGMMRRSKLGNKITHVNNVLEVLSQEDEGELTHALTHYLLNKYPEKKWIIDAGALQELELTDMKKNMITTPHEGEFAHIFPQYGKLTTRKFGVEQYASIIGNKSGVWLIKQRGIDYVVGNGEIPVLISGGNEGLTKGGTGDVLSALVAVLYIHNDAYIACSCASYILKKTADLLYEEKGPFYTTSELVQRVPQVLWHHVSEPKS